MKKSVVSKRSSYIFISVFFVSLCVIGIARVQSFSSSRVVLKDQAKIERQILHNSRSHHCHCFPPMISRNPGFEIINIGHDSASFHWVGDRPATYQVNYGLTREKGTLYPPEKPTVYYKDYTVTVTGLTPNTTYHAGPYSYAEGWRLVKKWIMSNKRESDWEFTTLDPPTSIKKQKKNEEKTLALTGVSVKKITANEVTITWRTNIPSTSQVEYGKTAKYGLKSGENTELTLDHTIQLFDLESGVNYYYRVASHTSVNATSLHSSGNTFTTSVSEDRIVDKDNYFCNPNPAADMTEFNYYLYQPITSLHIDIFTLSGKKVATLKSPETALVKGWNRVAWNLNDMEGNRLGNGLYVCKLKFVKGNTALKVKNLRLSVNY